MVTDTHFRTHVAGSGGAYQVIVAGGGPAGLGAALAAARQGASTLLLEARSFFGGVAGVRACSSPKERGAISATRSSCSSVRAHAIIWTGTTTEDDPSTGDSVSPSPGNEP